MRSTRRLYSSPDVYPISRPARSDHRQCIFDSGDRSNHHRMIFSARKEWNTRWKCTDKTPCPSSHSSSWLTVTKKWVQHTLLYSTPTVWTCRAISTYVRSLAGEKILTDTLLKDDADQIISLLDEHVTAIVGHDTFPRISRSLRPHPMTMTSQQQLNRFSCACLDRWNIRMNNDVYGRRSVISRGTASLPDRSFKAHTSSAIDWN